MSSLNKSVVRYGSFILYIDIFLHLFFSSSKISLKQQLYYHLCSTTLLSSNKLPFKQLEHTRPSQLLVLRTETSSGEAHHTRGYEGTYCGLRPPPRHKRGPPVATDSPTDVPGRHPWSKMTDGRVRNGPQLKTRQSVLWTTEWGQAVEDSQIEELKIQDTEVL